MALPTVVFPVSVEVPVTLKFPPTLKSLDALLTFPTLNALNATASSESPSAAPPFNIENVDFESVVTRYPDKDLTWYGYRRNGTAKPFCIEIKYLEPGLYEYAGNLPDVFGFLTALELNN